MAASYQKSWKMSSEISLPNAGADVTVMGFATNYRRDGRLQICLAGAALRLRPFADRTHPPPENTATKKTGRPCGRPVG
jgi:hypothetical protein